MSEPDWETEAKVMLRAINTAPHLFALHSLMRVMGPKLARLADVSPKAAAHLRTRAEERERVMTGVA